jgi:hypothetical protein
MVNRGWVPIDAGKHRLMLAKYIGEGFTPMTLRGILRKEEYSATLWGESKDNLEAVAVDLSWALIRPWNMMRDYFGRRWGVDSVEDRTKRHGARHYYIEMIEDFSGDDQRMINGKAWPRRRDLDEIQYVHLTPIVHTMYTVFWWCITAGSLYGMHRSFYRQKQLFAARKALMSNAEALEAKRRKEAQAFYEATVQVEKRVEAEAMSRRQ